MVVKYAKLQVCCQEAGDIMDSNSIDSRRSDGMGTRGSAMSPSRSEKHGAGDGGGESGEYIGSIIHACGISINKSVYFGK